MNRVLFLAALMAISAWAASTTYTFTGLTYPNAVPAAGVGGIMNFTSCTVGPCADFTTAMSITGSFTVPNALAPNLGPTDISAQVTSFSFSNGVTTFTSGDPNLRIFDFVVGTDASGNITSASTDIFLEKFLTGSSPHSPGDRVSDVSIATGLSGFFTTTDNNQACSTLGTSDAGVPDSCTFFSPRDSSTSFASQNGGSWIGAPGGGPGPGPTPVPTLSEWGMIFLAGLLLVFAWLRLRRPDRLTPAA